MRTKYPSGNITRLPTSATIADPKIHVDSWKSANTLRVKNEMYVIDGIIFAAWLSVMFPKLTTAIEDAVEFQGQVDRILCQSSSFIFTALLIFWKVILLFLGL